jgi:hypothetical protein
VTPNRFQSAAKAGQEREAQRHKEARKNVFVAFRAFLWPSLRLGVLGGSFVFLLMEHFDDGTPVARAD